MSDFKTEDYIHLKIKSEKLLDYYTHFYHVPYLASGIAPAFSSPPSAPPG